uniref:ATP synthase F0 subunit 8 n=1 Tax=Hydropsyche fulvipes TaxID=1271724 RepID=A0A7L7S5Z4_9NEOP|nr:ATP synthase F0 subunit 8 [Hydropsyche fulvipes]
MPQMMPLNWLLLMLMFMIMFMFSLSFFYYIKSFISINKLNLNNSKISSKINWSW